MKKPEKLGSKEIEKAVKVLQNGGVVIFPTDTVFGIGARWDDPKAAEKIFHLKSRPQNLPLPVLLAGIAQLEKYALITPLGLSLAKRYWPGAATVILKRKKSPSNTDAGLQTLGFRVPNNDLTRHMIEKAGFPIIGTSANLHGKPSVKNFKDLDPGLIKQVDYVLNGNCSGGVESAVIDATGKLPVIIRKGALTPKAITLTIDTTKREEVIVSIRDDWSQLSDKIVTRQQTGSQALVPAVRKILSKNKADTRDLIGVEVNTGPGSFTGTRVGVTVANALGFALNIPVNGKLGKIALPVYEKSKFD